MDTSAPERRSSGQEGPVELSITPRGPTNPRSQEVLAAIMLEIATRLQIPLRRTEGREWGTHTWRYQSGHFRGTAPSKVLLRLASREEAVRVAGAFHGKAINLGPDVYAIEVKETGNSSRRRV